MSTPFTESEQWLEQYIRDCGHRIAAAYAAQDFEDALKWYSRRCDAINSRSREHQDKLTARIDRSIDSNWFQSAEALELGRVPHA